MANICTQLSKASEYVSLWLIKQPNVNEESLTDWLLFHISMISTLFWFTIYVRKTLIFKKYIFNFFKENQPFVILQI